MVRWLGRVGETSRPSLICGQKLEHASEISRPSPASGQRMGFASKTIRSTQTRCRRSGFCWHCRLVGFAGSPRSRFMLVQGVPLPQFILLAIGPNRPIDSVCVDLRNDLPVASGQIG